MLEIEGFGRGSGKMCRLYQAPQRWPRGENGYKFRKWSLQRSTCPVTCTWYPQYFILPPFTLYRMSLYRRHTNYSFFFLLVLLLLFFLLLLFLLVLFLLLLFLLLLSRLLILLLLFLSLFLLPYLLPSLCLHSFKLYLLSFHRTLRLHPVVPFPLFHLIFPRGLNSPAIVWMTQIISYIIQGSIRMDLYWWLTRDLHLSTVWRRFPVKNTHTLREKLVFAPQIGLLFM